MTDPEQATIGDLFRLITDMRSDFGARLTKIETNVDSLRGEVRAKYSELGQQIDATNAKIGTLERRLVGMQGEIGGLSSKIAAAGEKIANVGAAPDGHTA